MVDAAGAHQLFMSSTLDHEPILHQQDQIGAAHGREPVRNHEGGSSLEERGHRGLNQLLALRIQIAGGFIQDEDLGSGEDRPGNGQALLLAA